MPAKYLMTWDGDNARWRAMHNGKRYVRSCRQLKAPPTKEGSYQAANEWWLAVLTEIDGNKPIHPQAEAITELEARLSYAEAYVSDEVKTIRKSLDEARQSDSQEPIDPDAITDGQMHAISLLLNTDDEVVKRRRLSMLINKPQWEDRKSRDLVHQVPKDRTLGTAIDQWIGTRRNLMRSGELSPGGFDNLRRDAERFRDYTGSSVDVASLSESTVANYYAHLLKLTGDRNTLGKGHGMTPDSAKTALRVMRTLIRHFYELRLIPELPPNLDKGSFAVTAKKIETFTILEVNSLIKSAKGQLRLHILLALNCGMTAVDINDLKNSQVDWQSGRIIRKRSKEADITRAPTVDYKLWDETFRLLRQWRSGQDTVLLTESGGHWCWDEMGPNGKLRSSDNVATNFNRLRTKIGGNLLPFKHLRKTGVSLLETRDDFAGLGDYYLGQTPKTVKDRHYAEPPQTRFEKALSWLGTQFEL